jgi:hypothetical protein
MSINEMIIQNLNTYSCKSIRYFLPVIFFLFGFCAISPAQDIKPSKFKWHSNNLLKINTIGLFSHFTEISYERVIDKKFSILVSYGDGRKKTISGDDARQNYLDKYGGYSINYKLGKIEHTFKIENHVNIDFRYYVSHRDAKIPNGFHIGPSFHYYKFRETFTFFDEANVEKSSKLNTYKIVSINASIGVQVLIYKILAIDIFLAPGYGILTANESESNNSDSKNFNGAGFTVAYGIFSGIAFGK